MSLPLPPSIFLHLVPLLPQAQARFNESNQKLDLLRYSLEQRLSELPKNHPRSSSIVEELALLSSPALSPRASMLSTQNQYSTVAKPAALTGTGLWGGLWFYSIICPLPVLKEFPDALISICGLIKIVCSVR